MKSILVVAVHTLLGLGRAMELSCFVINGELNSIRLCHNTSHNFPLIHRELRRKSTQIPPTLLPSKNPLPETFVYFDQFTALEI